MQHVYGLVADHGDGSAGMRWFRSLELVNRVLEREEYYQNEGSPSEILNFPDELDLAECGFSFNDQYYLNKEDDVEDEEED